MEKHESGQDDQNGIYRSLLKQLHQAVWRLKSPDQSLGVLLEFRKGLDELGIGFQSCIIYVVEGREDSFSVRFRDLSVFGKWCEMREEGEKKEVVRVWKEGKTICRLNLEQENEFSLGETPASGFHPAVGSALEIPFSHGVLGLYSHEPGGLRAADGECLEQLVLILSMLFNRLEDLEKLNAKERQLRQVQRLQLMGQLAAEVAHEINNPLTVVIGECDLLLDGFLEPEVQESIQAISKAGLQAQAVSNRLLEFVRGHKTEKEWINFNRLVQETLELTRRMLNKENIGLEEDLARNLPWIEAHAGQIQQVALNLLQNSRDALHGYRVQGKIRVRTYARDSLVVLEVEDNGPGIPKEIQDRVFEPFFTTKSNGQGTGLGLSVCAGIAKEHGGKLRLEPRLLGTCMVLELPVRQTSRMSSN